jgi:two-component system, OmpR family, phosphate regulon sensor histidine kinase PhoR
MKKGIFFWLVILALLSLPGIIAVQFLLYRSPLTMNNELFSRIVNESLIKAVQQYEINEDVRTIDNGIDEDASNLDEKPLEQPADKEDIKKHVSPVPKDINTGNKIFGNKPLTPGTGIALRFQDWETKRPIDIVRLMVIVEDALKHMGIVIPFHYAIFSGDSIANSDIVKTSQQYWYKVKLFQNDILSRDLYLGICFPETDIYLHHNPLLKILSIIFTLLICLTYYIGFVFITRQKKLSAMNTDFINNMTHEFKTQITTIGLAVNSILSEEVIADKDRVNFYSRMIRKENQRMNEQVERILQVARLYRKELYFRLQEVNVHELIKEAIQGISIQIEKRGGRINVKLEAANPIVATDPVHFTNLVNNLLDNANKYSPDAPEILISTTNDQKGVYITVEDKGIGISKKVQAKIFDKYYRLTSVNLVGTKGFGLGLSYIKAILKLNKGCIKVQSEEGKGSRFVVFIPYLHR